MNGPVFFPVSPVVVMAARRLMDPLETDQPLGLHEAASRLGILHSDLDRALWAYLGHQI